MEWIFYLKKKIISPSRYLDICIFGESKTIEIFDVILDITARKKLTFRLFVKIWSDITVIYGKHFELIFSSNVKTRN